MCTFTAISQDSSAKINKNPLLSHITSSWLNTPDSFSSEAWLMPKQYLVLTEMIGLIHWLITVVTYIAAGIQLYKSPEGGQLKNQQPSKSPSSASAQKRGFSSCCGTKGMCGNASQRHSFISWLSKHTQRNIWILMCTLSLICLWNMNINLGKRGLISNRALTWNV